MTQSHSALRIASTRHSTAREFPISVRQRLAVKSDNSILLLSICEIVRCTADSNYCVIHTSDGKRVVVAKTLKHVSDVLATSAFVRVHQSHLVSLTAVREVFNTHVTLTNGDMVPVSRSRRMELRNLVGEHFVTL